MRRFAKVLRELMDERELTLRELGSLSGLDDTKIHRLCGSVTRATREDLERLFSGFPQELDRYRLMLAHIQDELPETGFQQLEIQPSSLVMKDVPRQLPSEISLPLRSALFYLLEEMKDNPTIGDVLTGLATSLGWSEATGKPHPNPVVQYSIKKPARSRSRFEEVDAPVRLPHGKE